MYCQGKQLLIFGHNVTISDFWPFLLAVYGLYRYKYIRI